MTVYVNTFFEKRVQQLFDLAERVEAAFAAAGLEYRVIGGLAVYLYVEEAEPDAGRLTRDIDIAVRREDLEQIARAVEPYGLQYRHVAGVDLLIQTAEPSVRRAVHLIFTCCRNMESEGRGTLLAVSGMRLKTGLICPVLVVLGETKLLITNKTWPDSAGQVCPVFSRGG